MINLNNHTEFPYTSSNTDVWDILKVTDADPNAPDSVILIYTGWKAHGELGIRNEELAISRLAISQLAF